MALSFALRLHLALQSLRPSPESVGAEPLRPNGTVLWLHIPSAGLLSEAGQLLKALRRLRPDIAVLISGASDAKAAHADTVLVPSPHKTLRGARAAVARYRPDLVAILGAPLPAAFIVAVQEAGCPLAFLDANAELLSSDARATAGSWQLRLNRDLLPRFQRIIVPDPPSEIVHKHLGLVDPSAVLVQCTLSDPPPPLPCTEAERAALTTLLRARPIWFAVCVPQAEDSALLGAHQFALRRAHRLLLIIHPETPDRAANIVQTAEDLGLRTAMRAAEQEPDEDVQVFVVDDKSELGLWYRLAPVTWMGGSLSGATAGRPPSEPAALGSAIVHGPHIAARSREYARLTRAQATREVLNAAELGQALSELIAPDKVAILAHRAWESTSGDARDTERAARVLFAEIDRRAGRLQPKEAS